MSFKQRENAEDWLSLADLSMGGFIIFLVLTIVFISRVPKKDVESLEKENAALKKEVESKATLIKKLDKRVDLGKGNSDVILQSIADSLKKEAEKYNIDVLDNGAIRFRSDKELFISGSSALTPFFRDNLDDFLGLYFQTIAKYKNQIAEIRIDGHTDTRGDYMTNLKLSQERAFNVLEYIRNSEMYIRQDGTLRDVLDKCIIANGYSYAKALDTRGRFINESSQECDLQKSRRVEFKIFLKPFEEDEVIDKK